MQDRKLTVFKKFQLTIVLFSIFILLCCSIGPFGHAASNPNGSGGTRSRAYDFEFEFITSEYVIEPNSSGVVEVKVTNKGDEDSYSLSISPLPSGWTANFDNGNTQVTSGPLSKPEYDLVQIYINTPSGGSTTLQVSCTSNNGQTKKTASASLEAKLIIKVNLVGPKKHQSVNAGKSVNYILEVKNHQSVSDVITLSLDHKFILLQNYSDPVDWSAAFDVDSMVLDAGENKNVILLIYAPTGGNPGDKVSFQVLATNAATQIFKSTELIAEIPRITNITYELTTQTPTTLNLPNSTINYTLKLFNVGNVDTVFSLDLHENIGDWGVLFFKDKNQSNLKDISLGVNDHTSFHIDVKIPLDALEGVHNIIYGVYSKSNPTTSINEVVITTNVNLVSDIALDIYRDPTGLTADPNVDLGKVSMRWIVVQNKGNGLDTLNISIFKQSVPSGWTISFDRIRNVAPDVDTNSSKHIDFFDPIRIDYYEPIEYVSDSPIYDRVSLMLGADKKAYLRLVITTPGSGKPATETLTIYGESQSGTIATTILKLKITLRVSDIIITKMALSPKNPIPGQDVTVRVNLSNVFHLSANNFYVKLFKITEVQKLELESKKVTSLAAGENLAVEFKWTEPKDGPTEYILEAELSGDIIPKGNLTPTRMAYVEIGKESKDEGASEAFSTIVVSLIVAIFLAIIVFLFVWLFILKRQKPKDPAPQKRRSKTGTGSNKVGIHDIKHSRKK